MTSNEQVYHKDEANWNNYPLSDEDEECCVAEDSKEYIWQDKGNHSQEVSESFALVGVGNILEERDPAKGEAHNRDVGAKADFVAKRVHELSGVQPRG